MQGDRDGLLGIGDGITVAPVELPLLELVHHASDDLFLFGRLLGHRTLRRNGLSGNPDGIARVLCQGASRGLTRRGRLI